MVFDANILAGAATAARKVRDAAIVSVYARTRRCASRRSKRRALFARARDAPLVWPYRSSRLVGAIHLGVRVEPFSASFSNPKRRVTKRRLIDQRRCSRKVAIVFGSPKYPFSRETAVGPRRTPGELFRARVRARATTPTHRTTPAHFSQWRRRTTSPRPRPRRRRCVPATRRTRVRMPVLILSPTSFLISQPRLANARRRGTAGPARDAICARRAAAVGTARPRRLQNPAPRDRRTIGSASASRRFARLT